MKHSINSVKKRTYNAADTAYRLGTTIADLTDRLARGETRELNPVLVGREVRSQ